MVMLCSAPVSLSRADTCRIPLASISNITSIWGSPRAPGRIALEPEAPEDPIVGGPLSLALQDHDVHRRLVVFGGAEGL